MGNRNWFWGLFFLLAGVMLIAGQFGLFGNIGVFTVIATVFLVWSFAKSIVKLNYVGICISAALVYILYQKPLNLVLISPWILIVAALFVGSGLSIIFRKKPQNYVYGGYAYSAKVDGENAGTEPLPSNSGMHIEPNCQSEDSDNHPYVKASFGSASRYLHSTCLESGQFYNSFGELSIYMDNATVSPAGASIYVDCSLGVIRLFVPRHWKVIDNINVTLGEVEVQNNLNSPQPGAPTIMLTGNVSLGSIELVYV